MSRPRSNASPPPTPTKHRRSFIRGLSSFSKPVEEWGIGSVPVLSTSVTPRRERGPTTRSRVPPIRPLSIATVSTFGGWMQERVDGEDEAENGFTSHSTTLVTLERSEDTHSQHSQPVTPIPHKYLIPDHWNSPPANRCGYFCRGHGTNIHPLGMHPPSLSPSFSAQSISLENQKISLLTQRRSKLSHLSTPLFDETAFKACRETISTRRSRRTLPELNIDAANGPRDKVAQDTKNKQIGGIQSDAVPAGKHSPCPQDGAFVEAMRLWYQEKENEAVEDRQRERKFARRAGKAGTAGCAVASVGANQRL